jgi:putative hemolysin
LDPEPSLLFSTNLDINLIIGFVGIFILLFLSAIVSGAEVALFSLSQKNIDDTLHENSSKGKIISNLLDRPKKLLATLLVANNFLNIGVVIFFLFI